MMERSMTSLGLGTMFGIAALEPRVHRNTFALGIVQRLLAVAVFWPHAHGVAIWEGCWAAANAACLWLVQQ